MDEVLIAIFFSGRCFYGRSLMDAVLLALPFCLLANSTARATRHRPFGVPPSGSITGCLLKCTCTAKRQPGALPPAVCVSKNQPATRAAPLHGGVCRPEKSLRGFLGDRRFALQFCTLLTRPPWLDIAWQGKNTFPEPVEGNIHQKIFVNNWGS